MSTYDLTPNQMAVMKIALVEFKMATLHRIWMEGKYYTESDKKDAEEMLSITKELLEKYFA